MILMHKNNSNADMEITEILENFIDNDDNDPYLKGPSHWQKQNTNVSETLQIKMQYFGEKVKGVVIQKLVEDDDQVLGLNANNSQGKKSDDVLGTKRIKLNKDDSYQVKTGPG